MTPETTAKLKKQLEFYFSDWNYGRDKYLRARGGDDGRTWTNISDILTFNKIRAITQTAEDIMTALKESEIIETEQESQMMRRKQPFVRIDDDERTIYVKNFTLYPAPTVEELTTFFGQYGKVDGVTIRKYVGGRAFKGSVFVTFETAEEAKKALDTEAIVYKERPLITASKKEYFQTEYDAGGIPTEHINWEHVLEKAQKIQAEAEEPPMLPEQCIHFEICDGSGPLTHDFKIIRANVAAKFGEVVFFEKANGRDEPMTAFNVKCKEAIKAETLAEYNNDGGVEISGKQLKVSYADESVRLQVHSKMNRHARLRQGAHLKSTIKFELSEPCKLPDEHKQLNEIFLKHWSPAVKTMELRRGQDRGYINFYMLKESLDDIIRKTEDEPIFDVKGKVIKFAMLDESEDKDFCDRDRDMNWTTWLTKNVVAREDMQFPELYKPKASSNNDNTRGRGGRGRGGRGRGNRGNHSNNNNPRPANSKKEKKEIQSEEVVMEGQAPSSATAIKEVIMEGKVEQTDATKRPREETSGEDAIKKMKTDAQ